MIRWLLSQVKCSEESYSISQPHSLGPSILDTPFRYRDRRTRERLIPSPSPAHRICPLASPLSFPGFLSQTLLHQPLLTPTNRHLYPPPHPHSPSHMSRRPAQIPNPRQRLYPLSCVSIPIPSLAPAKRAPDSCHCRQTEEEVGDAGPSLHIHGHGRAAAFE